jgi:hypothetical protein
MSLHLPLQVDATLVQDAIDEVISLDLGLILIQVAVKGISQAE